MKKGCLCSLKRDEACFGAVGRVANLCCLKLSESDSPKVDDPPNYQSSGKLSLQIPKELNFNL
jgi:hypothetical protein